MCEGLVFWLHPGERSVFVRETVALGLEVEG